MPTPDRRAGRLEEEEVLFDDLTGEGDPEDVRSIRYADGVFRFVDAKGIYSPEPLTTVQVGGNVKVPRSGSLALSTLDGVTTLSSPIVFPFPVKIVGAAVRTNDVDTGNDYNLSLQRNGTEVATVAFPAGTQKDSDYTFDVDLAVGDELTVLWDRTAGSGKSDFRYTAAAIVVRVML